MAMKRDMKTKGKTATRKNPKIIKYMARYAIATAFTASAPFRKPMEYEMRRKRRKDGPVVINAVYRALRHWLKMEIESV